jgi:hypothetical protein
VTTLHGRLDLPDFKVRTGGTTPIFNVELFGLKDQLSPDQQYTTECNRDLVYES